MIHWGVVGERGQTKAMKGGFFSSFRKIVQQELDKKMAEGFAEIDEDDLLWLEIEYAIDDFVTEENLDKRHQLEEKLDELLGWTGLGHMDGGSIGDGRMEVGCFVVDFDIAKRVIEEALKGTEFGDYSSIVKKDFE